MSETIIKHIPGMPEGEEIQELPEIEHVSGPRIRVESGDTSRKTKESGAFLGDPPREIRESLDSTVKKSQAFSSAALEIPNGVKDGIKRRISAGSAIDHAEEVFRHTEDEVIFSGAALQSYAEEIHIADVTVDEAISETVSHGIIAALIYLAFLLVAKTYYFVPWDPGFALVMLWSGSMALGMAFKAAGIPQLLGMLCAGIILKNAIRKDDASIVDLPEDWSSTIRSFGLVNILMRGGLEMDLEAVKRIGWSVVWLTVIPGVTEALAVCGLACALFGMPFFLALAFGFTLAAVSPAIVVGGMFDLQSKGYGVEKGIPTFVVAAASFDDVVAISGFSMFIGLAVGGSSNIALLILGGPINIIVGFVSGALGGIILSWTRIWNTDWKRSIVLVLLAMIMKFGFKNIKDIGVEFDGAGALAALVMACVAAQMWQHGWGGPLATGVPDHHASHSAETYLCLLWKVVSEPLLFSVIGSALDFSTLKGSTIPLAGILLVGCVAVRTIMAFIATQSAGLNMKERMFVALAWMPKASVQAALGAIPLAKIMEEKKDESNFEEWKGWGSDILTTAVFSIILTAPLGLLVIQYLGPKWLEQDETTFHEKS